MRKLVRPDELSTVPVAMRNAGDTGIPDVWSVYLAVDEAKTTVDAAVARGGQVHVPAMEVMDLGSMALISDAGQATVGIWQPGLVPTEDTPYGRLASASDPTGAQFKLLAR